MPAGNEQYPSTRYPIESKSLEDLVHDPQYELYRFLSFERSRQLSLDPDEFESIPRDYCILQSPGKTSWLQKESQKPPDLKIFYADSVKIPKTEAVRKLGNATKYAIDNYLYPWYLQGMSRSNVDKLLRRRFGLSIPLSCESTADHWIPAAIVYCVEIKLDVWENRLALFFDGNMQTSVQPMKDRLGAYRGSIDPKVLGEVYLSAWRARWERNREPIPSENQTVQAASSSAKAKQSGSMQSLSMKTDADSSDPKPRGRKRRKVLRQLRSTPNELASSAIESSVQKGSTSIGMVVPIARGRLRRRELRKNKTKNDRSVRSRARSPAPDDESGNKALDENPIPARLADDDLRWRFNSGERLPESRSNKFPVALVIQFTGIHPDKSKVLDTSSNNISGKSREGIPLMTIRYLGSQRPVSQTKRFHIISYCNRGSEDSPTSVSDIGTNFGEIPAKDPTNGSGNLCHKPTDSGEYPNPNSNEPLSQVEDYPIHVATLIDEAGFVDGELWDPKGFISIMECDPSPLLSYQALTHPNSSDYPTLSRMDSDQYWHKFSTLLCGFTHPEDFRDLPYSLGYGHVHTNPDLVYRRRRWGHLEVDSACPKSRRPRWRAAWKFELLGPESEKCNCSWDEVSHDLNTCRYMHKEIIHHRTYFGKWHQRKLPDDILPNVLSFVHKPYEVLQKLDAVLHKYEPPYLPSKDPNDGEKGAVPSSDKNPEKFVTVAGPPFLIRQDGLSIRRADNHTGEDDREAPHQNNDITRARLTEEQVKSVERTFEMGVCHLMGLGVSKNITKGIQCMVNAAMKGSLRARAMVLTLATSYSVAVDIPDEVLESWLCETSKCGSKIALRELQSQFPTKYKEIVAVNRFAFDLQHSEVFKHPKDVLPTCDWNDIAMISMEFKTAKSRLSGPPEADREEVLHLFKSMNSMALTSHGTDNYGNVKYYIFGTPLHLASLFGFEDAVEIFLDAGFDIDGHNSHPALRTPLLCALSRGHTAIATLLIKRGANCEPLMMWRVAEICSTPSPLHYLVNIDDDKEAVDLARLLVKGGADVNAKCDVKNLNNSMDIPVLNGNSVTPLRWAVIHEKVQLVKVLLTLGAKFAYEPYLTTVTHDEDSAKPKEQKGCLLLETPCTNLEILEMFFARARVPGLPTEFSQTPFGLLVSEDDGPERRLRPGFEDTNKVLDALRLLLDLQPGFEDVLLWSAVRHDHVDIVKYLLDDLGWDVECKWKGLTCLHTAVLYGRLEMVQYLLEFGADVTAVTETRGLTCLHLLMLYPRDPKTDQDILKSIASTSIDVNAKEKVDGLTALHIAVRNQKLQAVQELLRMGADPSIPVTDQLHILSQGKFGFLEKVPERLPIFTNNLTILGEVIIQYIQDSFYSHSYVADLLVLLVDFTTRGRPFTANDLIIDKGNGISLLHLLAITPFPESPPRIHWKQWHYFQPPTQTPTPPPITAPISLLQLLLIRTPSSLLNLRDYHNDTPLHYACAASQYHNIETLLSFGADRTLRNKLNLTPVETLAWSVLFLGGKTMHFQKPYKSWHPSLEFPGRFVYLDEHKVVKPKRSVQGANDLSRAFETFRGLGMVVDERLRRLVCAWEYAGAERDSRGDIIWSREDGSKKVLEIVPESSASGWDWEKETEQDSRVKEDGSYDAEWDKRIKRPYFYAAIGGPRREKRGGYWTEEFRKDERIEGERGAL